MWSAAAGGVEVVCWHASTTSKPRRSFHTSWLKRMSHVACHAARMGTCPVAWAHYAFGQQPTKTRAGAACTSFRFPARGGTLPALAGLLLTPVRAAPRAARGCAPRQRAQQLASLPRQRHLPLPLAPHPTVPPRTRGARALVFVAAARVARMPRRTGRRCGSTACGGRATSRSRHRAAHALFPRIAQVPPRPLATCRPKPLSAKRPRPRRAPAWPA